VNDIAVLGAEAAVLFGLSRHGQTGAARFTDIIKGFARACAENNCALIGGETAQMPGFYQAGEYDLSGTIVAWWKNPRCSRPENHPARRRGHRHRIQRPAYERLFLGRKFSSSS